jgi:hypothetical protein
MIGSQGRPTMMTPRPAPADFVAPGWARELLEWRKPKWHRSEWELWAGAQPIGALVERGGFRERALGHGPSGDWEFGSRWSGEAWISPVGSEEWAARFRPTGWGGGTIMTASGLEYGWRREGFWRPDYIIATDSGFACVRFRHRPSSRRFGCGVAIEPEGLRIPELEALIFLGWRLLVMRRTHA